MNFDLLKTLIHFLFWRKNYVDIPINPLFQILDRLQFDIKLERKLCQHCDINIL